MARRVTGRSFLALSAVVAAFGTLWIRSVLESARGDVPAGPVDERVEVVVAAADLGPGEALAPLGLALRSLPRDLVPHDALLVAGDAVGRVPLERILGGEVVREGRLAAPDAGPGLVPLVPRGMRALQVPVKGAAAGAGFVEPGNTVDLIAVCAETEPPQVRTIARSLRVLAVGRRLSRASGTRGGTRELPSLTLAVTPSKAEAVKHAWAACRLTVALRGDLDVDPPDAVAAGGDRP